MKMIFRAIELRALMKSAVSTAKDDHREVCGLLVWNGLFIQIVPTRNRAKTPCCFRFYVSEAVAIEKAVEKLSFEIAGTYHSHPFSPATPGPSDIGGAFDGDLMLIADVTDREYRLWRIKDGKSSPVRFSIFHGLNPAISPRLTLTRSNLFNPRKVTT